MPWLRSAKLSRELRPTVSRKVYGVRCPSGVAIASSLGERMDRRKVGRHRLTVVALIFHHATTDRLPSPLAAVSASTKVSGPELSVRTRIPAP